MTLAFWASLFFAAVAAAALAGLYLVWPRQLTAEEWVLHRRAITAPEPAISSRPAAIAYPGWLRPPEEVYQGLSAVIRPDLSLLHLFGGKGPDDATALFSVLSRRALIGGTAGFAAGAVTWLAQGHPLPPWVLVEITMASLLLFPAFMWISIRRQAGQLRATVENRLPRLLTAARMLLESGAATPERALTEAIAIHDDPASDVVREALRLREVRKLEIEEALDEVAGRYAIEALMRLADGFRIGRRYGTGMARMLAEHALDLRALQHQRYRERITRAPVLMTVPALLFFVGPLLVLIMYLVFSPLFQSLRQL